MHVGHWSHPAAATLQRISALTLVGAFMQVPAAALGRGRRSRGFGGVLRKETEDDEPSLASGAQ